MERHQLRWRVVRRFRENIRGEQSPKEEEMTIKEMRELLGISRTEFSRRYGIPLRTLEDWESGKRTPPPYVINLLERIIKEDADEV